MDLSNCIIDYIKKKCNNDNSWIMINDFPLFFNVLINIHE